MQTAPTLTIEQKWQWLLHYPIDQVYDHLARHLQLPLIGEFPRPGEARTWTHADWIRWGNGNGFVSGARVKHGQIIQHQRFPSVCVCPAITPSDERSAKNCAMDARKTLINFLERAFQVCRVLAQDKEEPSENFGEWLTTKLTGTVGQQLMERAREGTIEETPEQSSEADALLKRLKALYPSIRQALCDSGITESAADKIILLNKGRTEWTFTGLAGHLIPAMKVLLADHFEAERAKLPQDLKPVVEPEVLAIPDDTDEGDEEIPHPESALAQLDAAACRSLEQVLRAAVNVKTITDRVSLEVPDFVRLMRNRNTYFNKMLDELNSFQKVQHAIIKKAEESDLIKCLIEAQTEAAKLTGHVNHLRSMVNHLRSMVNQLGSTLNKVGEKLAFAEATTKNQADHIAKLEEQLTDPQHVHQAQKIKEVRALFKDDLGFMETATSIQRAKQMLDALIKANDKKD